MMRISKLFIGLLVLCVLVCAQTLTETPFSLSNFSGMVDILSPDELADKYSPDCLNVRTDDLGVLSKRTGYRAYGTAFVELQSVRKLYNYLKTDGSSYIIANSSWSMYANVSGADLTAITGGLDSNYTDSYITAKDYLYRDNGYTGYGGKWDGATYTPITVLNSTNPVTGKLLVWWHNRYFKAGVTANPNVIFYSEVNDPDNFGILDYINVSINDGDIITALIKWGDRLLVTKLYATYEVIENSAGSFVLRLISNRIGCLYVKTYDELNGSPLWMSHRGVEQFNGSGFTLLSEPINNLVRKLPQLISNVYSYEYSATTGFGAGQGVSIDTTTILGSVALQLNTTYTNSINQKQDAGDWATNVSVGYDRWQTFRTSYTLILSTISVYGFRWAATTVDLGVALMDKDYVLIASQTIANNKLPIGASVADKQWLPVNFANWNITLTAESTYYIVLICSGTLSPTAYYAWGYSSDNLYDRGRRSASANEDQQFRVYLSSTYAYYVKYGQYQSQVYTGASINRWSALNINQTLPTGTNINWFVSPATAAVLCTSNYLFPVSSPSYSITMSSPVPYIMFFASMTTTNIDFSPRINNVTLDYIKQTFGSKDNGPVGITYQDRYYLFVATNTATNTNNVCLCFQKDGSWTMFNDINALSACTYLGKLYTGDSTNTGLIYETFVDGLYTDNGSAYPSYWKSKLFDMGSVLTKKLLKNVWLAAENSGDWNLSVDYEFDESGIGGTFTFPLGLSKAVLTRLPFPDMPKATYVQFTFYNNNANEYFKVRNFTTSYEALPIE